MAMTQEDLKCPSCGTKMETQAEDGVTACLPIYIDHDKRKDKKVSFKTEHALPVDVYICPNCRRLVLFGS